MQILVNTTALAQELRLLNHIVVPKTTSPILLNVLIKADGGLISLTTTDLEIAFQTFCPATVHEPGEITLPAKRLLDMIDQLPDTTVELNMQAGIVLLYSGSFHSRLQTLDADDFPTLPIMEGEITTLPTAKLQEMVRRVQYSISDKGKYTVNGALFTLTPNLTALVSTDGKRLALTSMAYGGQEIRTIIPAKALEALLSMFTEPTIMFSQHGNHLFFKSGDRLLSSRMLDLKFPTYEGIIPRANGNKATVVRASLAAALRRVGLVAEENGACYFTFQTNALDITSSSASVGDAAERVVIHYEGEPLKVSCNWRYVLDFLEVCIASNITMELNDHNTPMLLTESGDHIAVVMLMRN